MTARLVAATAAFLLSALLLSAFPAPAAHAQDAAKIALLDGPDRQRILEDGARKEGSSSGTAR